MGLVAVLGILTTVIALILSGCASTDAATSTEVPADRLDPSAIVVTVHQLSTCNCCSQHVAYLEGKGFQVEVVYIEDGGVAIREEYPVPPELRSCHVAIVEGYFVEGHMPSEAIMKLLTEKPAIDGIALPGMPSGSPGMPGAQTEPFIIYALADGVVSEFLTLP